MKPLEAPKPPYVFPAWKLVAKPGIGYELKGAGAVKGFANDVIDEYDGSGGGA